MSETAFIIGGGASLRPILSDIQKDLVDKPVFCTNNAYKLFPDALSWHFFDYQWFRWNKDDLLSRARPDHLEVSTSASNLRRNDFDIKYYKKVSNIGIAVNPDEVCGNNTGHQSLNIAIHKGYRSIVLLGFDMNHTATELHYHNEHQRETNRSQYTHSMIPDMELTVNALEMLGVSVFNANPESALRCFEFGDYRDFL